MISCIKNPPRVDRGGLETSEEPNSGTEGPLEMQRGG